MSQKTKKNSGKEESAIALKNHNLGCMWGIFHNLQQNRWPKVVKKLPRTRLGYGKHSTGQEKADNAPKAPEVTRRNDLCQVDRCAVEVKPTAPSPAPRSSIKSRIKALITEEVQRRKLHGRKSTSHPEKESKDDHLPSHHEGKSLEQVDEGSTPSAIPKASPNVRVNYLKQSEVDEPVRDHILVQGNLVYAIEPSADDSLHESKMFMSALTLLNMREEMFLTILKDPNSSLANQPLRQSSNLRHGLSKSMSFSAPPSDNRDFEVDSSKKTDKNTQNEGDQREAKVSDSTTSPAAETTVRKKGDEKVGLLRFKNIREKIKYVIRDKKKEKNRIMMDALHHKVPYGKSPSKKLAEDIEQQGSDFGSNSSQGYKRTSSFDDSLDRYNQLLDISSSKEAKDNNISDESKLKIADTKPSSRRKPATLGRIHSSPVIRSYFNVHTDDKSDTASVGNAGINEEKPVNQLDSEDEVITPENGNQEVKDVGEVCDEAADSETQERGSSHDLKDEFDTSPPQPSKLETAEAADLEAGERASLHDSKDESKTSPFSQPSKSETDEVPVKDCESHKDETSVSDDSKFCEGLHAPTDEDYSDLLEIDTQDSEKQNTDSCFLSEDMINLDIQGELDLFETRASQDAVSIVQESHIQQSYSDMMRVQGDVKHKAEFNYVKDVLELSGFSKNESLREWQSAEYPLDPSMFGEVGESSADQDDCCGNENGISNQLLLFDMINEVLLQVHERSLFYWPSPLTNRSNIHALPKGSRVLEEVWAEMRLLLKSMPSSYGNTDDAVSRDLAKTDGWMNLQVDAECVGIELEELIFNDLIKEIFVG